MCASGSVVEHRLAKARVAGSNPVSRLMKNGSSERMDYFFVECDMKLESDGMNLFQNRNNGLGFYSGHAIACNGTRRSRGQACVSRRRRNVCKANFLRHVCVP